MVFGSLPLYKYYLYALTLCCSALLTCPHTQGSFYWFLEGLHADFFSSLESQFQDWALHPSLHGASNFLWSVCSLMYSTIWLCSFAFLIIFYFRNYLKFAICGRLLLVQFVMQFSDFFNSNFHSILHSEQIEKNGKHQMNIVIKLSILLLNISFHFNKCFLLFTYSLAMALIMHEQSSKMLLKI